MFAEYLLDKRLCLRGALHLKHFLVPPVRPTVGPHERFEGPSRVQNPFGITYHLLEGFQWQRGRQ